jgi:outer membrane protein insertion porin family
MQARSALILLLLASVSLWPRPARAAVDDYLGKPIGSVRLLLDGRETTEPALLQLVETQVGRPLSMLQVRETVSHLYSLGRFDDVRVDAALGTGGVALSYELTPIHIVSEIRFAGSLRGLDVDVGELRRAVVDRYGTSPPLGRVNELSVVIVDALRERGYRAATATPQVDVERGSQRATLIFAIEPGPRTVIGTIDVQGMPMIPVDEFLSRLGLRPGVPYEPDALNARITEYVDTRRARGYYEARITPTVTFDDSGRTANIALAVDAGPHVTVIFSGEPLPGNVRDELVPIEREGSADEDLLEDSSNRIEQYLRAEGYRDARAPHKREERGTELVIAFDVRKGPQYRVGAVEFAGDTALQSTDIRSSLRTRVGEPFSDAGLDADVSALESIYRARGFAGARVQADARPQSARPGATQVPVAVSILVTEGVRTLVRALRFEGNTAIPETELMRIPTLQPGAPYFEAQLRRDTDALQLEYANRGYRTATVLVQPQFSDDRSEADLVFIVREGPRVFVDHVLIVGNVRTSTATIERELQLRPGDPLSLERAYESQRRLAALQLFRRAPQLTEIRHGDDTRRDLLITVEEAEPTTLGFGGGIEGRVRVVSSEEEGGFARQKFELAPRAFVDLGRRNLFGSTRSVNFFSSISLHLQGRGPASPVGYRFTEYRVLSTFREPRVLGTGVDGFVTGTIEQQIRSSFNLARQSATLQASRRLAPSVGVSGGYQLQHTELLDVQLNDVDDQPFIDRVFSQVRLSSFSAQAFYDTRDEPVDSTRGEYVSANVQLAARRIGSEVGFVKSFFTAQLFRPLPLGRGSVFAAQGRVGIATGFSRDVVRTSEEGETIVDRVKDVPEPERFFAGGDTTVRGFALDTLGRPDTIKDGFPIGGNGETIFNVELRGPVFGGLQGVGFVDTGNVFAQADDIDFGLLRTAVGFGFRYKSPVGPIRFDMGFKVHPEVDPVRPEDSERRSAWFITFGQAF